jgi:hypothetical protein
MIFAGNFTWKTTSFLLPPFGPLVEPAGFSFFIVCGLFIPDGNRLERNGYPRRSCFSKNSRIERFLSSLSK